MEKVRSRERAIDKLAEFANEFSSIEQIAILQSTSYPTEETKMLQERLAWPVLVDGRNVFTADMARAMGWVYRGVGRGS